MSNRDWKSIQRQGIVQSTGQGKGLDVFGVEGISGSMERLVSIRPPCLPFFHKDLDATWAEHCVLAQLLQALAHLEPRIIDASHVGLAPIAQS